MMQAGMSPNIRIYPNQAGVVEALLELHEQRFSFPEASAEGQITSKLCRGEKADPR